MWNGWLCAAKFGTPNTRLETLFQYVPDVRRLGLWHYKMTTDPSLGVAAQQRQPWRHSDVISLTSSSRHLLPPLAFMCDEIKQNETS